MASVRNPSVHNPSTKNLIVLSVKLRNRDKTIDYLFPLNPASLTINQASRVSATFTYGAKVFQNLGAGLKTLSIEGHTGYRLSRDKYGLQDDVSSLAIASLDVFTGPTTPGTVVQTPPDGKIHWLDLYSIIQLIKGENKYLTAYQGYVKAEYEVDNIDNIENVQITIPDQGITYDVLLQNDSFMRNREQPHLYKYKLDFIIVQESQGTPKRIIKDISQIPDTGSLVSSCSKLAATLTNAKKAFMSLPGIQAAADAVDNAIKYVNEGISVGNFFITAVNSTINDLRRLERMNDCVNKIATNLGLIRGIVTQLKTFSSLNSAFYESYISLKHLKSQMSLMQKSMAGDQQSLQFNVNLTRLASISAPVTLASNKATVAQFQKDIRQLNRTAFPFPVDRVEEITTDGVTKINVFFKVRPASLGISKVKIFSVGDFGNETDLVESMGDTNLVMATNYNATGYLYNFFIEYNYTTFESIVQPRYKSIKRILIQKGDTLDSIVKKYAPNEANSSRSYLSEVAYLNNIEYPYVVTTDNTNFDAYFGSYGYKIFSTNGEFLSYINNIDTSAAPAIDLVLYEASTAILDNQLIFLLQQPEVIDQIKTGSKFFVLLFKETYSSRCYAVFGIVNSATATVGRLFTADSYVICALEKGRSYDINNNALFEILSPYTITGDLIDYYDVRAWYDDNSSAQIELFDTDVSTIEQIYLNTLGPFFTPGAFVNNVYQNGDYPFTNYDHSATDTVAETDRFNAQKIFLAGNEDNQEYVILTTFTATGSATNASYAIAAFSQYRVMIDGEEILLPSLENNFLPFAEAFTKEDTYKVDLDVRFQYLDDIHVSILPRPDLGVGQGYLDFKLISGLENVKQAIKNRLECPQGGLTLHMNYGLPVLLGKKNTLEHLILLRYNLFNQLMSDNRVRSANNIKLEDAGDAIKVDASVVLVNNDDVLIKTVL